MAFDWNQREALRQHRALNTFRATQRLATALPCTPASALLDSAEEPSDLAALAHRDAFPDAAFVLDHEATFFGRAEYRKSVLPILHDRYLRGAYWAKRVGIAFGALSEKVHADDALATLRRRAKASGRRGERAAVALAALGLPCRPWPQLSRRERAALLLGRLVACFHARESVS